MTVLIGACNAQPVHDQPLGVAVEQLDAALGQLAPAPLTPDVRCELQRGHDSVAATFPTMHEARATIPAGLARVVWMATAPEYPTMAVASNAAELALQAGIE